MAGNGGFLFFFVMGYSTWLNLQEGWWRLFRRDALAGQSFANAEEIEQATRVATIQLNQRATLWIWVDLPRIIVIIGWLLLPDLTNAEVDHQERHPDQVKARFKRNTVFPFVILSSVKLCVRVLFQSGSRQYSGAQAERVDAGCGAW